MHHHHHKRPLTTTYRHDYLLPNIDRYEISKQKPIPLKFGAPKAVCEPHKSHAGKKPHIEWTRNHVTKHILSPRFIPEIKTDKPVNQCMIDKPNKYLLKIGKFPKHLHAGHKRCCDTFRTTYQLDFPEPNTQFPHHHHHRFGHHHKNKKSHSSTAVNGITDPCSDLFSKFGRHKHQHCHKHHHGHGHHHNEHGHHHHDSDHHHHDSDHHLNDSDHHHSEHHHHDPGQHHHDPDHHHYPEHRHHSDHHHSGDHDHQHQNHKHYDH